MQVSAADQKLIEKKTRGQANNMDWFRERRGRITASIAKQACGKGTSIIKKIVNVGKLRKTKIMSLQYGIDNEDNAALKYKEQMEQNGTPVILEECGLFVCKENGQLAASPDRIVNMMGTGVKGCLEIKCLFKCKDMQNISEAVTKFEKESNFPLKHVKGQITIKENHSHYYQIQMQMAVTTLPWCDFVVFTNKDSPVFMERVHFNSSFWGKTKEKILDYHQRNIVPALACMQFGSQ